MGGGGAAAALIAISLETDVMFGRSGVVLVAGGLGIVIVLALLWIFAWRRKRYVIEWDDEGLRIVGAGSERSFPWESISRVLIRLDTDYARIEVRDTDDGSMTLLAGFGSQDVKRTNAMDPIPVGVTNSCDVISLSSSGASETHSACTSSCGSGEQSREPDRSDP